MDLSKIGEGLIICEQNIKREILALDKESDTFVNHSFMSRSELFERLFFKVEKRALFLIAKEYKMKPQIALQYINAIAYLIKKEYNNEKLIMLNEMKAFLLSHNALKYDKLFPNILKSKKIYIVGYEMSNEWKQIIQEINKYNEICFIEGQRGPNLPLVKEFLNVNDEIRYTVKCIKELIYNGTSLENIKICNVNDDYLFPLIRVLGLNNIPIKGQRRKNVLSTKCAKSVLNNMLKYATFDEVFAHSWKDNYLTPKFIDIVNSYEAKNIKPDDFIDIMRYEMGRISYEEEIYENMLELVSLDKASFTSDDFVFILGFNQNVPYCQKNEGFITDDLALELGLSTTLEKNKQMHNLIIKMITQSSRIHLSYSLSSSFSKFRGSNIISELGLNVEKEEIVMSGTKAEDDLIISQSLDSYFKYNQFDDILKKYYDENVSYKTFDHHYKGIRKEIFDELRKPVITLSYSAIKEYYACAFSYYLNRILRVDEFSDSLQARLGTFAHAILMDSYQPDFSFEESKRVHEQTACDAKEKLYYDIMAEVVVKLIDFNKAHEENSILTQVLCEHQVNLTFDDGKLIFTGFIDKLKYSQVNGELIVAIMDYKTGSDKVSLDNLEDGLNMQLPVYLYLLKKSESFSDATVAGFYLQHVTASTFKKDAKKSCEEQLLESFRLEGYSLSDKLVISYVDSEYQLGKYLKNVKINADQSFSKSSLVLSKEDEDKIVMAVEDLITKAYEGICDAKFDINPKRIKNENYSCCFCHFKDICFAEYSDGIDLEVKKFLGGDEDVDTTTKASN